MIQFYLVCFILSLLLMAFVGSSLKEHSCFNLGLLVTVLTISNGGFLALSLSENVSEAMVSSIMLYAGGTFLPMLYFCTTCEICSLKIPRWLNMVMYGLQIILYAAVCCMKFASYIYTSVELVTGEGGSYLIKEYGFGHTCYVVSLYTYTVLTVFILVFSIRKRNKVSFKNMMFLIIIIVSGVAIYMVERSLKMKIDIIPAIFLMMYATLTAVSYRMSVYNTENKISHEYEDLSKVGCISFDRKLNLASYNDYSGKVFPELKKYNLDVAIPDGDTPFNNTILDKIRERLDVGTRERLPKTVIQLEDSYYEFQVDLLYSKNNRWYGYLLVFTDVSDHQKYLNMIQEYNSDLECEVEAKTERIQEIQEKTLLGLAQMVESRDLSTGGHIKRTSSVVSVFSKALLEQNMGFTPEFLRYVERGAPMHDLGKITVDDDILRKQAKFTPEEYEVMKTHAAAGYEIVKKILTGLEEDQFVEIAANMAHYHHEKVNGQGYPDGLKGEEIPIEARIMALADVFDALVSKRCYKEAFSYDKAFSIIKEDAGSHFDQKLAEVFLTCRPQLEELYDSFAKDEA